MKITGIRLDELTTQYVRKYKSESRSVGPLDMFEEYASDPSPCNIRGVTSIQGDTLTSLFLYVMTDEGLEGQFGPMENRSEIIAIVDGLERHLIGKDPLENLMLWDLMSRYDRHSRSGSLMKAISAVDIALWDLKGKILSLPVYKLLGGGRGKVRPYISTLGFSVEPEAVRKSALMIRDQGIGAQKWFFRYGPGDGMQGLRKNLDMAFALRDAVGEDYEIMFDAWMGWTVSYARAMFRELEKVHPMWVEEPLRPHLMEGYRKLKEETGIPISAGEHFYTRMEVNQYLRDHTIDVMQSDPAWCGGITEAKRIGDLCDMYGITFAPHGATLMPAVHVVAASPVDTAPYCEYLLHYLHMKNGFFRQEYSFDDGWLTLNTTPGLGEEIDHERIIAKQTIHSFAF